MSNQGGGRAAWRYVDRTVAAPNSRWRKFLLVYEFASFRNAHMPTTLLDCTRYKATYNLAVHARVHRQQLDRERDDRLDLFDWSAIFHK